MIGWAFLLAPLIGIMLAVFGAGGGMLTVPLLNYGLGLPLKASIAASLWVVGSVSLVALLRQRSWQHLKLKLLALLALGGAVGSWLGAHFGLAIAESLQGIIFGLLVWFVAWWMHYHNKAHRSTLPVQPCSALLILLSGILLGIVTGMLGVGGGFMMVPALMWLGVSDYKIAVRHSLLLIVINAVVASATYAGHVAISWVAVLWITALAVAGTVIGGALMHKVSSDRLQSVFSLLLVLVGFVMVYGSIRAIQAGL